MQQSVHEVIIIGCGISGIGASQILSSNQIQHIILQARHRIGGRICSHNLDGVMVDMGAMIVHHPHQNNRIKQLMDKIGWKSYNKRYTDKQIMIGPDREISQEDNKRGNKVYKQILSLIQKSANSSERDLSFLQALTPHVKIYELSQSKQVMNYANILFNINGNIEGADLQHISGRDLYVDDQSDVIPEGGYAKLIQQIYNFHPRKTYFGEKVAQVNYQSEIIQIKTNKGTYYTKKLISSLPLGVLKAGSVKFIPPLPQQHLKSINNIGFGVFNKIQVSFDIPFWDVSKQYILLVSQGIQKYYRIRCITENNKFILCVYVSGSASRQLSKLSDKQMVDDFISCLKKYYTKDEIKIKDYVVSRWHQDQFSLGSYSYFHVDRTTIEDIYQLKKPIQGKIWFVGQHCCPQIAGTVNAAFISGIQAVKQIIKQAKAKANL